MKRLAVVLSVLLAPSAHALDVRRDRSPAPVLSPAQVALARTLGPAGVLGVDPVTRSPRVIMRTDGFLTGRSTRTPAAIVRDYVLSHRAALGLTAADWRALRPLRDARAPDGSTTLVWAQTYRGLVSVDTTVRATVDRFGRLVSVGGSPVHNLRAPTTPVLSVADAVTAATDRLTAGRAAGLHDPARLVLLAMGPGRARLGWQLWLDAGPLSVLDVIVDARNGRVLRSVDRVLHAGRVSAVDYYPGAPSGGAATIRDLSGDLTAPDRLEGNNAHVFLDPANDDTADPGDEVRPDANGDFVRARESIPSPAGNCPAAGCSWNHLVPNSWQTNLSQNAQQVFFFLNHFADHLRAAPIGFDEASGNFQAVNATGAGKGGDAVQANTTDGAATAVVVPNPLTNALNANMLTPADGTPPRMQMYLFEPLPGIAPDFADVNGGDDASIVYHEYTHGLTNRLVTLGDGNGALTSPQAGAMGEAWSDFYAMDFLISQGFETDTAAPGELKVGEFTDNGNDSIRTEPVDCTLGADATACPRVGAADDVPQTGGYAYDAFGKILGEPEVHADGEIWVQTLTELRRALIGAHGVDDGQRRALALVTGGLRLSPAEPSFLDMRNSILAADTLAGGEDHKLIWTVFARRGMGYDARAVDGFDTTPTAGFALLPAAGGPTGAVSGTLTDADTRTPLVGIPGGLTSFFSGLASDLAGFSARSGVFTVRGVPAGSYGPVRVGGLGYEKQTLGAATVVAGETAGGFDAALRRNWAMLEGGARITRREGLDQGCGPALALDADPTTGFEVPSENSKFGGGPKTLELALPAPVDVSALVLDPTNNCGSDATSSLGGYALSVSRDGTTWTTVADGTFAPADRHPNAIPLSADQARGVRFVRLEMKSAMGPSADPTGADYADYMDLTELSVYGRSQDTESPTIAVRGFRSAVRVGARTLRGRVADDFAVARFTVDGAETAPGAFVVPVTVGRGINRFRLAALDASQHRTTKNITVRGDARRPRLRLLRARRLPDGRVRVRGRATDDTGVRRVRVAGRRAKTRGSRFTRRVRGGSRRVRVVAVDLTGRRTTKRVRVR